MLEQFEIKNSDNKPLLVTLDSSYIDDAPLQEYPWLLWLFIKLKTPESDGLWSEKEHENLLKIIDELQSRYEPMDILHVGYKVQEGWLELYYYAPQGKRFQAIASDILKPYMYTFEAGSARDTKWDNYRYEIYPNHKTLLYIQSMETINALKDEGDDVSKERGCEHYLFFQLEAQRERAITKIEKLGFTCKEDTYNSKEEYAYGIVMVKSHSVDEESIHQIVDELDEIVTKEHGIYEGWSTTIAL
jgi:regulator of RNase E activity RraB